MPQRLESAMQTAPAGRQSRIRFAFSHPLGTIIVVLLIVQAGIAQIVTPPVLPAATISDYLPADRVLSSLRPLFDPLGDRLSVAGKERVVSQGVLTTAKGDAPLTLISELPARLRIEDQSGTGKVLISTEAGVTNSKGQVTSDDDDLIESLGFDGPEFFLYATSRGAQPRVLGWRFRTDDGRTPNYKGPYFSLFQLFVNVNGRSDKAARAKTYYFDWDTHLLDRVHYRIQRGSTEVVVETILSGWTKISGQSLPGKIVRTEDGKIVTTFKRTATVVSPKATDGLFGKP